MLPFIQQPYVFALVLALATASLVYLYTKTTDPQQSNKAFFKTLAMGSIAGVALTYMSSPKPAISMVTEPFDAPAALPSGI